MCLSVCPAGGAYNSTAEIGPVSLYQFIVDNGSDVSFGAAVQ